MGISRRLLLHRLGAAGGYGAAYSAMRTLGLMGAVASAATPAMALRMATVETLAEELFLLQTLGDDRSVAEVYVSGARAKSVLGGL